MIHNQRAPRGEGFNSFEADVRRAEGLDVIPVLYLSHPVWERRLHQNFRSGKEAKSHFKRPGFKKDVLLGYISRSDNIFIFPYFRLSFNIKL